MKSSSSARGRVTRVLGIIVAASLLSGLLPSFAAIAQPGVPASREPAPAPTPPLATTQPPSAQSLKDWHEGMRHVPLPKKGCFTSSYPRTQWQEVPCTTAPAFPQPPARGPKPSIVGNGNDVTAEVSGHISEAIGSFDSVTGVTSETGINPNNNKTQNNIFSLQLNSNTFDSPTCSSAGTPSNCQGWQQFVFDNADSDAYIQYWLLGWGKITCPSGWMYYNNFGDDECYTNSNAVSVPSQVITNLVNLSVTGEAVSGGMDTFIMAVGSNLYTVQNEDSVVYLAQGWVEAEFNVFGDGNGTEANFNSGSTIVVRTSVDYGSPNAPSCYGGGFTGETNNLYFVNGPTAAPPGTYPAIVFTESSAASTTSPCNSATTVGSSTTYTLTASVTGSGTVSSSPSGISCPSTCSAGFTSGTSVSLTATPANGWIFSGWGGACSGTGGCTVTMNSAQSVSATFTQVFTLSVSVTGSGAVTSSPTGVSCPSTCSASFSAGTTVTLTPAAASGWSFSSWGGACSGSGGCVVTMNATESVTATFTQITYTLSVNVSGIGTVTSSPSGINCGATCSATFNSGTPVMLTATPGMGAVFYGWTGACSGTGGCTVTMNSSQSVAADFVSSGTLARRTWVSSAGSDSNNCSITAPCATFAGAIFKTAAGGEINCLTSGSFGGANITIPITIDCHDNFANAIIASGDNGFIIITSGGTVTLRNISIEGQFAGSGSTGIFIPGTSTVAAVYLDDVLIENFSSNGILDARGATGALGITNSTMRNNAADGIFVQAPGCACSISARLENVHSVGNATGIEVGSGNTAVVSRSVMAGNSTAGVVADTGGTMLVDNTEIAGNGTGVVANGVIVLANSDVYFNTTGVFGSGFTASYGNNRILGNTSEGTTPAVGAVSTDHGQE